MAKVAIEDLSGHTTPVTGNPYDSLINATNNDPKQLQARYDLHRRRRNEQQKALILSKTFPGWILDDYLVQLDGPARDANFTDPRNCLVFWARPPQKLRTLIHTIQQQLLNAAPDLWLMPLDNLHMTALEVAHSLPSPAIDALVSTLLPDLDAILALPQHHRARLIKPTLSYDSAALALSFVPAASNDSNDDDDDDAYTYHHLRRDIYHATASSSVAIGSRYVVPSAHLTIARFNTPNVFGGGAGATDPAPTLDPQKRRDWIYAIEAINAWLEDEYWPQTGTGTEQIRPGGEWVVGEERGLDFRKGRLWYGGGETVRLGEGFVA